MDKKTRISHARAWRAGAIPLTAAAMAGAAMAQSAGGSTAFEGFRIEPSVSAGLTFTNNANRDASKDSETIIDLGAGLRVSSNRGRLRGSLDYALGGSLSSRNSDGNEARHTLNMLATAELVDQRFFVDARAQATRQAVSAFGVPAQSNGSSGANESQTASLSLSPYLRGESGTIGYEARLTHTVSRADAGATLGDGDYSAALLRLGSAGTGSRLGWTVQATHDRSEYGNGRVIESTRGLVELSYLVTPELRLGLGGGSERSDLFVAGGETTGTWRASAEWNPSPRSSLNASAERRVFGNAHALRFSHRTPGTVWTLSSSRDISTPGTSGRNEFGTVYDLFFRRLESTQPDPVLRDQLVRDFLAANGLKPDAVIVGGFLTSAAMLQRAQSASVALVGARNTVTLQWTGTRSERADTLSTGLDDLSNVQELKQSGISLSWAYRLTPTSTLTVTGGYERSEGESTTLGSLRSTNKSLLAAWSAELAGGRSSVSAGLRHTNFDSNTAPYDESTVFASYRHRF